MHSPAKSKSLIVLLLQKYLRRAERDSFIRWLHYMQTTLLFTSQTHVVQFGVLWIRIMGFTRLSIHSTGHRVSMRCRKQGCFFCEPCLMHNSACVLLQRKPRRCHRAWAKSEAVKNNIFQIPSRKHYIRKNNEKKSDCVIKDICWE